MNIPPEFSIVVIYFMLCIASVSQYIKPSKDNHAALVLAVCWSISAVIAFCAVVVIFVLALDSASGLTILVGFKALISIFVAVFSFVVAKYFKNRDKNIAPNKT